MVPPSPSSSASASPENLSEVSKPIKSLYSNYIFNQIQFLALNSISPLMGKISSFVRQIGLARSRRRKPCLPLPVPSKSLDSSLIMTETSKIFDVLEDLLEHLFSLVHNVQTNLHYWEDKAEGSNAQKAYFMLFERGPKAFICGSVQFVWNFITEDSSFQILCHSASDFIAEKVTVLDKLRHVLAKFLAQVYMEINKQGENLSANPQKSLTSMLITIHALFSDLETSIHKLHHTCQIDSSPLMRGSLPPVFSKMTRVDQEGSQSIDDKIRVSVDIIYCNLHKLDSYVSLLVDKHRKPRKIKRYWIRFTCGIIGLSVCSVWIVRHSRLVGSPDIDNWIREAKRSTIGFWTEHAERPALAIRNELFETFRKRHRRAMEAEEVQLTSNSLRRMMLAFCEQTNGPKLPQDASDQELLEIVVAKYEKELMNPIKSIVGGGELPRALLIQVQKLKLDIDTAMLELNQILRANEINFAILAAFPAVVLMLSLIMLLRSWIKRDKGAEGRGRIARRQRRLLVVEIERMIMQHQSFLDVGQVQDAEYSFGLVLYTLDRLYRAVEKLSKRTGEWACLRRDIIDLAKPGIQTTYKLTITARMERVYDCMLPLVKR